jgi:hypothetical protein
MVSLIPSNAEANTVDFDGLVGGVIWIESGRVSTVENQSTSHNYYSVKWAPVLKADQVLKGENL